MLLGSRAGQGIGDEKEVMDLVKGHIKCNRRLGYTPPVALTPTRVLRVNRLEDGSPRWSTRFKFTSQAKIRCLGRISGQRLPFSVDTPELIVKFGHI